MSKSEVIIIDGYGFVFRAYHSMPPLTRNDGTAVGAVYGFTNMLYKLILASPESKIIVALDSGSKSFRNEIYAEYKANRPPAPEDLIVQFPIIRQSCDALNVTTIEKIGFEADDLIGTLAKKASPEHMVKIVSSDKDLMQLVNDNVVMYDPIKSKIIDKEAVKEKFGVYPDLVIDALALIGDSSDNVPGVPSIGPKTAAELLNIYGNLDGIYQNLDKIKQNKRRETLTENQDKAYLSKELVTLDCNVEIDDILSDISNHEFDNDKLYNFLNENSFKALISKLKMQPKAISEDIKVTKISKIEDIKISEISRLAIYFNENKSSLDLLSISFNNYCYYIIKEQEDLFTKVTSTEDLLQFLKPYFEDDSIEIITNNSRFLRNICKKLSINVNKFHDITIKSFIINAGKFDQNIEDIIGSYLEKTIDIKSLSNEKQAVIAYDINKINKIIDKELALNSLTSYYQRIEKEISDILFNMEKTGIFVDSNYLEKLSNEFGLKINEIVQKIYDLAGEEFNIASPKQLGSILFEKLALPASKKSKTGQYITNAEVLEELSEHEIVKLVLEHRQYSKLKNTYTDALPKQIKQDGRIHSNFSQTSTNTGRLSSSTPNLQNIPIRTEEGNKIRKAFIAKEGYKLISADYSQIELRLLAEIANIESLKKAFNINLDIHKATASEMFNVDIDNIDSNLRRKAKTINFGIIYGISAFGLSNRLNIPRKEAKEYIEAYFLKYPGIKKYMDNIIEFAKSNGFVKTITGRKCYIKNINSKNYTLRQFSERAAINAPLQGSSADIIKIAMVEIDNLLKNYDAELLLQVHDELIFEVKEDIAEEIAIKIKDIMEKAVKLSIPLTVDYGIGNSWDEIH